MAKAEFQLEPLTCPTCVKKIESTLTKAKGVDSVKVLFSSSKVKTEFDDTQTNAEKLKLTIENLGYTVLTSKVS
ncbi:copper chaperone [Desulfitobacterium dehalogenans ATCC 51507]|uniref:Copper chaperone n=1 Tax=Desulfitobacterium dehalogenans (strain ATCC 51507 / DSM 9161 / JW/IU-DC1) TaxID=756499 RepID=I4A8E3_DESDJ|nr:heavy-metal-associated domain-containing protein [Desulfitobacterium dehalogenans]AFM00228.1 copper chaperone [Desulfitobacterium dehalogenans ATCC 51507]